MDLGCNHMPKFCSRLIFLLEDFLRSTNETRCFLGETCQDLVQLNKSFSAAKSYVTSEMHERTQASVDKSNENVKLELPRKKYKKISCNVKHQINEHTHSTNNIKKLPKSRSESLRTNCSSNLAQSQNIMSGVIRNSTCNEKRIMPDDHKVNGTEFNKACMTDAKTNLKCVGASITKSNEVHYPDRHFPCNCKIFNSFECTVKQSEHPLYMLNLFKNHNSYLVNTMATTDCSSIKNSTTLKSDINIVENGSPEKRFLNNLSFVNGSGLNEATDPMVKLLYETQSIYLAVMEISNSKEYKFDSLLWERITCLERRFLHLLNICESASYNMKDDKKQRGIFYKNKIILKSDEFWNQSCAIEIQGLIDKPYVKYKSRSQWENYQKTLHIIQQKNMQLKILETLISDFLPQLQKLDPNSPNINLLLTMAFTLTGIDKHSIPLLVKV